jgi:16S rRNA G966 N2-methylase RsmD
MNNFFDVAPEFITEDNRRIRTEYKTSFQSIQHRLEAQLPPELIKNKTILDIGSCVGAAGYYSLQNGAKHYTGVELQKYYAETSNTLLKKYCNVNNFKIVKDDILVFLNQCSTSNIKYDIILAAGILYQFMDPILFLQNVAKVANEVIIIDTKWIPPGKKGVGRIMMRENEAMVIGENANTHSVIRGVGSLMCCHAIDIVMLTEGFEKDCDIILPKPITDADDPYNIMIKHYDENLGPKKIILRYKKNNDKLKKLNDILREKENKNIF